MQTAKLEKDEGKGLQPFQTSLPFMPQSVINLAKEIVEKLGYVFYAFIYL